MLLRAPDWQTQRFRIRFDRPRVMGIVNVTPDSFSDGGQAADPASAIAHCERLVAEGADILDIGGESTRPGAARPGAEEELKRVLPVLREALRLGVPVSVDTSEPAVMRAALELGADIVNDVRALRRAGALEVLAAHRSAGVCLMHMRGEPENMQQMTGYADVLGEVGRWLLERAADLRRAGVATERIALDPGIGFAKTAEQCFGLLAGQQEMADAMAAAGHPLLVGWSRKSALGHATGRAVGERLAASVTAALLAVQRGAAIVRVHDVRETRDALAVWAAALPAAENRPGRAHETIRSART